MLPRHKNMHCLTLQCLQSNFGPVSLHTALPALLCPFKPDSLVRIIQLGCGNMETKQYSHSLDGCLIHVIFVECADGSNMPVHTANHQVKACARLPCVFDAQVFSLLILTRVLIMASVTDGQCYYMFQFLMFR
ncbi:hypothetical protein ABBQ38_004537 [Trebouxia sp. C0009 RCD-2024]